MPDYGKECERTNCVWYNVSGREFPEDPEGVKVKSDGIGEV